MNTSRWLLLALLFGTAAIAEDAATVWKNVSQPALDPAKALAVSNATIERDRIKITLIEGHVQLSQAAEGVVFGAAFQGRGRIQVAPPAGLEQQQLRLFTGQDALDMEFSEATFSFNDNTAEQLAAAGRAGGAAARLQELYLSRQNDREDVGAELLPRLFKGVLSKDRKRGAFFVADLKTRDKGWIQARFDALELEEVKVGRWTNWGNHQGFDTWLSFPAGDRSAAAAHSDPLARDEFQIKGYKIDATVTGGAELRAITQLSLAHRVAGERVLLFEFDSNLRIESVKDTGGAALPFFQPRDPKGRNQSYGDYVAVVLPEPAQAGQNQTFEFRYAGKRVVEKVGAGSYFCQSFGWYPTRPDSFAARADFELSFRYPKRYKLVATGNKLSETVDGDSAFSTWKSDLPLAVAGFAFGDYKLHSEKVGAIEVEIYANKEPDDFMRSIQESAEGPVGTLSPSALVKTMGVEVANTLKIFERYYGPYPYKRLAVTNIPFSYGQGWPMLIYLSALSFLDSTQRNAFGIKDHSGISDFFRAHESSHQWWGHRVGWKSYHDQWISEGFAQFSGNLYVQFRENWKKYLERLRKDREELLMKDQRNRVYESLGPVTAGTRLSSSETPGAYGNVVYNKGGYILHMVRMLLWDNQNQNADHRFQALMQDFCQTFHNKPASTEDFKAVLEKHMLPTMDIEGNRTMDWFFNQYVYGTGVPKYQFRYTVKDAGPGKWEVAGNISQSGVPAGWKDVVPLYIETSGRMGRLGWMPVREKETPFKFTLPVKPDKLVLNHNEDLLAEIK